MWTEACHLQLTPTEEEVEEEEEVGGKTEEEGGGLRERETGSSQRCGRARSFSAAGKAGFLSALTSPGVTCGRTETLAGVLLLAAVPAAFLLVLLPGSGE